MTKDKLCEMIDERVKEISKPYPRVNYFDEYAEFIKNNPINSLEDFINIDIWTLVKYLYQIDDPVYSLGENSEIISGFSDIIDSLESSDIDIFMMIGEIMYHKGKINELCDYLEEQSPIKSRLILKKMNLDSDLCKCISGLKEHISESEDEELKDSNISFLYRFMANDYENVLKMMTMVKLHKELNEEKEFLKEEFDSFEEKKGFKINNKTKKKISDKHFKEIYKINDIINSCKRLYNFVYNEKSREDKYYKETSKEIRCYKTALEMLDKAMTQEEIKNFKDIIKNVKDENIKKAFLEYIHEYNMKYYNSLNNEYSKLSNDNLDKYISLFDEFSISIDYDKARCFTDYDIGKLRSILSFLKIINFQGDILKEIEKISYEKVEKCNRYLSNDYISKDFLSNNICFCYTDNKMIDLYQLTISILTNLNINPVKLNSCTDLIINKGSVLTNNLNILSEYNFLNKLKDLGDYHFLFDENIASKIDKLLELGYEKYLEDNLDILNSNNIKRLDVLKSINMIDSSTDLIQILNSPRFFISDSELDNYIFDYSDFISTDLNFLSLSDLDIYKSTNRVYSINGNLISINKVKRLLDNGYNMKEAIFYNNSLNYDECINISNTLSECKKK